MIHDTLSAEAARRLYNRLGARIAQSDRFEQRARDQSLALLDARPGHTVLHVGVGNGAAHARLQHMVAPSGLLVGLDLSPVMLRLTRQRSDTPLCEGDARCVPFAPASFDRLFCAYMLDLIPLDDLPGVLGEFRRVVKPGGRMVLVSLTEGIDAFSRLVIALWKLVYHVRPVACGGCRPVQMMPLLRQAGFVHVSRTVVVQAGMPSEVLVGS